jgi:hypothetical protein
MRGSWHSLRTLASVGVFLAFIFPGDAAEIRAMPPEKGVTGILIRGEIERGDAYDFYRLTRNKGRILVALSSPGGVMRDALTIGARIRIEGFATTVLDECDSACALIWLSGAGHFAAQSPVRFTPECGHWTAQLNYLVPFSVPSTVHFNLTCSRN